MSFDLVYYNNNSFLEEESKNHFVISNSVSNPQILNNKEIEFIVDKVANITNIANIANITNITNITKDKNITHEQLIKIIIGIIIFSQIFFLLSKTKT